MKYVVLVTESDTYLTIKSPINCRKFSMIAIQHYLLSNTPIVKYKTHTVSLIITELVIQEIASLWFPWSGTMTFLCQWRLNVQHIRIVKDGITKASLYQ